MAYELDNESVQDDLTPFINVAESLNLPMDAIYFVYELIQYAPNYAGEEPGDIDEYGGHASAQEICDAVGPYTEDLWGDEATAFLKRIKVLTSDDLGRLIEALIKAELMEKTSEDTIDAFMGYCRFVEGD